MSQNVFMEEVFQPPDNERARIFPGFNTNGTDPISVWRRGVGCRTSSCVCARVSSSVFFSNCLFVSTDVPTDMYPHNLGQVNR